MEQLEIPWARAAVLTMSGQVTIGGEGDANEENESEEEPIKLFVGQVRERNYCTVDV